jgi:hypothetical protein
MPAATSHRPARAGSSQGPALYYGYCTRTKTYRMMDLPEYVSNVQEAISQVMNRATSAYQGMYRNLSDMATGVAATGRPTTRDCGCEDCSCECCVGDADVLAHARCGEVRRIPVTFENDTRRERPVRLELGKFMTSGGRDLGWTARLSETEFTLRACGEHTVTLAVQIRCETDKPQGSNEPGPAADPIAAENRTFGSVDRCEVGYATIRAEGCLTRPLVVAIAVLPDHCDAYTHPCGCECCCGGGHG